MSFPSIRGKPAGTSLRVLPGGEAIPDGPRGVRVLADVQCGVKRRCAGAPSHRHTLNADMRHTSLRRVFTQAANGREAIQQFRAHRPDITLMDLQMPEMNSLEALIVIRDEFPEAGIIVLTTYTGDVQVLRALKADAQAYLIKSFLA